MSSSGRTSCRRSPQQAGRALRDLRRIAEGAKADLREGLGPEFQDFDFEDLNPRRFVQKHLLDDMADQQPLIDEFKSTSDAVLGNGAASAAPVGTAIANGDARHPAGRRGTALRRRGDVT